MADEKEAMRQRAAEFKDMMDRRGIVQITRVPPGMNVKVIREYFERFKVERIYLKPEPESMRMQRKKEGKNYQRLYLEGWIEFFDKELAKFVVATFNGQQVGGKKGCRHYDDIWNLKYLRNVKWSDLIESRVEEQQVRKKKLQQKIVSAKREHDEYLSKAERAKNVKGMLERKARVILEREGEDINDEELISKVISTRLIKKKKEES